MRKKIYSFLKEEGIYIALLILCMVAFYIPYFAPGLTHASENDFHASRIMSLAESLKLGIFPAKLRPMLMKGYGYGVGFFYPDFFFYIPAILVIMGVDVAVTFKLVVFVFTIVGVLLTYRSIFKFTGSKNIAVFMTILYFGNQCMWLNIYDGAGIGAFISQAVLPMAFIGLLRAFRDEKEGYLEYAIGIVVVVLSHHLTFISMMIAMVMIVIARAKVLVKNPKILGKLFFVSIVGMFFSAQYWMPAIELAFHTKYKVIYDNYIDINDHILNFITTIDEITLLYIIAFVVVAALFIWLMIREKRVFSETLSVLIVTVIHIYLMMSELIWRGPIGQFFAFFQSTTRLEYVTVVLMIIFMAMAVKNFYDEKLFDKLDKTRSLTAPWIVVLGILLILATRFYADPKFYDPYAVQRDTVSPTLLEDEYCISCGEWLPVECEPSECKKVNFARTREDSTAEGVKHDGFSNFDVWLPLDMEYFDMPYVYYYGYKAWLMDDAGNLVKELRTGEAYDDNGYLRVFLPQEEGVGHVYVTYRKTTVQKIAYIITILTTIFIVCYPGLKKKWEKSRK